MTYRDDLEAYLAERGERLDAAHADKRHEAERRAAVRQEGADALGAILDQLPQPMPTDNDLPTPDDLMAAIREDTER